MISRAWFNGALATLTVMIMTACGGGGSNTGAATKPYWKEISTRDSHTAAIKRDGTLWTWGRNSFGQLGNGEAGYDKAKNTPQQVGDKTDWVNVSTGNSHTVAINSDGEMYAWGFNYEGQLGQGTSGYTDIYKKTPQKVEKINGKNWVTVAAGGYHTLAINSAGELYAWGGNTYGQLGDGHDGSGVDKNTPQRIGNATDWIFVAAGAYTSFAINKKGELWSCGYNFFGQLGVGSSGGLQNTLQRVGSSTDWKYVTANFYFAVGLATDGKLYAWGFNFDQRLGLGSSSPNKVTTPHQIGTKNNWTKVVAGSAHVLALNSDGEMYAWGNNYYGVLGTGTLSNKETPTRIGSDHDWNDVSAGSQHSLAVNDKGEVYSWGNNEYGQLGNGTFTKAATLKSIEPTMQWQEISSGHLFTVAINTAGELYSWGSNYYSQLGDGTKLNTNIPHKIGNDTDWQSISAGSSHVLAIKGGKLYAWGYNYNGQVGDGRSELFQTTPKQIGTKDWKAVSAGFNFSLAIDNNNKLYAWGFNTYGQLGNGHDGANQDQVAPQPIGSKTWKYISASKSGYHSLAIDTNDKLFAWGRNEYGQLGNGHNGTGENKNTPQPIGSDKWKSISAGRDHSLGIALSGKLYAWGRNKYYQLGNHTTNNENKPKQVGTLTDWSKVYANGDTSAAINNNGKLFGWGFNSRGQLGVQNRAYNTPVQMDSAYTWSKVSLGIDHTMELRQSNELYGRGNNSYGQVGAKIIKKPTKAQNIH